jgi:hypothetical protein
MGTYTNGSINVLERKAAEDTLTFFQIKLALLYGVVTTVWLIIIMLYPQSVLIPMLSMGSVELPRETNPFLFYIKGTLWQIRGGKFFVSSKKILDSDLIQSGIPYVRYSERVVMLKESKHAVALKLVME